MRSCARSMPWSRLNSATIQSTRALSQLSPPRWLSPLVAWTSSVVCSWSYSRTETSNVPPPRSKTRIFWSSSFSRLYASAAAVGSFTMRRTLSPAILPASLVASRCALLKYAGTVMTASLTLSPRYASASAFSFCRIIALISGGAHCLPPASMRTSSFGPFTTLYGTMVISSVTSSYFRPMKRLTENTVFSGFVPCWRRGGAPTSRWPSFVNATTDGVVRPPSAFGRTVGSPPSRVAMHEFVVPRSMPIVFAIRFYSFIVVLGENLSRFIADFARLAPTRPLSYRAGGGHRDAEGARGDRRCQAGARAGARAGADRRVPRPDGEGARPADRRADRGPSAEAAHVLAAEPGDARRLDPDHRDRRRDRRRRRPRHRLHRPRVRLHDRRAPALAERADQGAAGDHQQCPDRQPLPDAPRAAH